ncbi:protein NETWORKED 2D-like [Chenopodium quinoa]|uniref:protein NETWORKED 2D-like n=1 Tax=Chenopodium quinoa TaxID=63459 RepID=UPI000B787F42|nr:protein NETWORKED 2D-like [Chenopodium quinoa]
MLQRAASNAYSWWYASHVRTKQSKWLEQSLQDMGDKVEAVLKLIEEDGDSFAKRAEMYYKKRPELINFVEESYRAYRSLAERYDHLSKELQNANNTLASAFPDQYQFPMDDDDDYNTSKMPRKFQDRSPNPNIPQAPQKFPTKNIKAIMALTSKLKNNPAPRNMPKSGAHAKRLPKSGLTITEAINEIDKLQKQILTLQTEKEFAKSSYENGYAKYWDIEEQISTTQEKISKLQDEFEVAQVIEDDEARTLMAEAAIKSCNDTLAQLQEKQERAAVEAKEEQQRIKDARNKLNSLKGEFQGNPTDTSESRDPLKAEEDQTSIDDEAAGGLKESKDLEIIRDKIKEHFDVGETASLSVLEMAEKIDELVNKVINLESSMSSQTALIHRLRSETDELQTQIKSLEDDKANLIAGKTRLRSETDELQTQIKSLEDDKANLIAGKTTLSDKLGELENKLRGLQDLNDSFNNQNNSLESNSTAVHSDLDINSKKSHDVKIETENKLRGLQDLNDSFDNQNNSLESLLNENHSHLDINQKKSHDVKPDEGEAEQSTKSFEGKGSTENVDLKKRVSDTSTSSLTQDEGQKFGETALLEPKDEYSHPLKTDDTHPQESKPSTIEYDQPQQYSNKIEEEAVCSQVTQIQDPSIQPTYLPNTPQEVEPRNLVGMPKDEPYAPPAVQPSAVQPLEERRKEEYEPDWQQLFTNGLEGKEKVLLEEYTVTLRNYKETKKKLYEVEKKNEDSFSEMKSSLVTKDEEIHSLRQKLSVLQKRLDEHKNAKEKDMETSQEPSPPLEEEDDDYDIKVIAPSEEQEISAVEQKLRAEMDQILEENLDFWMRFSASFGQIQKFQNGVQDLQAELAKLEKKHEKKEGSSHGDTHKTLLKSDVRPIYKHLREIQTELTVWLEQSENLKEELQRRFSQLCHIQEEIKLALSDGAEDDDMKFTSFQAAKFHGEVANMQQENNKVADELQTGMDYITSLQLEMERTIARLNDELGFSTSQNQYENERSESRARVPLRSFIFGVKPQKKKQSIFSCMHPGMMNRRYHHLRSDKSP